MPIQSIQGGGHSVFISDVTEEEYKAFWEWVDTHGWCGNVGATLFPSDVEGTAMMYFDSGFNHTWYQDIVPALEEYWGKERIIHEVEFYEKGDDTLCE